MSGKLDSKIALVTGASKGIGKAISELFASEGASVIMVSRNAGELNSAATEIKKHGSALETVPGDLGSDEFVEELFSNIRRKYGRLDILINNAGMVDGGGDIATLSPEKFREVMNLNVTAVFHCMQQAIKIMRDNGDKGRILNIASVRSHWTEAGEAGAYNASKYAVKGLTETVARLMLKQKSQITVGMICPGIVDTPIHEKWCDMNDPYRKTWLKPETVAQAVLHAITAPENINVFDTVLFPTMQSPF